MYYKLAYRVFYSHYLFFYLSLNCKLKLILRKWISCKRQSIVCCQSIVNCSCCCSCCCFCCCVLCARIASQGSRKWEAGQKALTKQTVKRYQLCSLPRQKQHQQLLCLHFIFIFKFIYYANLINYKVNFKLKLNSMLPFITQTVRGHSHTHTLRQCPAGRRVEVEIGARMWVRVDLRWHLHLTAGN